MTAGLPGIGIGGVFYILCAVLMPVKELWNTICGRTSKQRWFVVGKQIGLLCGIMLGFWLTGLLLGMMIGNPFSRGTLPHGMNVFHWTPMYVSFLVLAAILFLIRIINVILDHQLMPKMGRKRMAGNA